MTSLGISSRPLARQPVVAYIVQRGIEAAYVTSPAYYTLLRGGSLPPGSISGEEHEPLCPCLLPLNSVGLLVRLSVAFGTVLPSVILCLLYSVPFDEWCSAGWTDTSAGGNVVTERRAFLTCVRVVNDAYFASMTLRRAAANLRKAATMLSEGAGRCRLLRQPVFKLWEVPGGKVCSLTSGTNGDIVLVAGRAACGEPCSVTCCTSGGGGCW